MADRSPTVASQELGTELRAVLRRSGLRAADACRLMGWTEAKLSRLLGGKSLVHRDDVVRFLGVCRVEVDNYERLLALVDQANLPPGWWLRYGRLAPEHVRTQIRLEQEAGAISQFHPSIVPGLLQTKSYGRALVLQQVPGISSESLDERVRLRMERKRIFDRGPRVRYQFFMDESVLWRIIGGPNVMLDQLRSLLTASAINHVSIRFLPLRVGAHAGITGPFELIESATNVSAVYLENETSCLFLDEPSDVDTYRQVVNRMAGAALDAAESRALLAGVARRYGP